MFTQYYKYQPDQFLKSNSDFFGGSLVLLCTKLTVISAMEQISMNLNNYVKHIILNVSYKTSLVLDQIVIKEKKRKIHTALFFPASTQYECPGQWPV